MTHVDEVRRRLTEAMRATPPSQIAYDLLWALNRGDALERERDRLRHEVAEAQRLAAQWKSAAGAQSDYQAQHYQGHAARLAVELAQAKALLRRAITDRPMMEGAYIDGPLARQIERWLEGDNANNSTIKADHHKDM